MKTGPAAGENLLEDVKITQALTFLTSSRRLIVLTAVSLDRAARNSTQEFWAVYPGYDGPRSILSSIWCSSKQNVLAMRLLSLENTDRGLWANWQLTR